MTACGQCHHLLTVGAIPVIDQRKAKANPKNMADGEIRGNLYVTAKELKVNLAGGAAIETPNLLVIDGESVLSARLSPDDGRVLISATINNQAGAQVAKLIDNEWSMLPGAVWDFEVYPRHATIRTGHGEIAFGVDTRDDSVSMRGKWFFDGLPVDFSPTHANINGSIVRAYTCMFSQNYISVS